MTEVCGIYLPLVMSFTYLVFSLSASLLSYIVFLYAARDVEHHSYISHGTQNMGYDSALLSTATMGEHSVQEANRIGISLLAQCMHWCISSPHVQSSQPPS